MKKSLLALLCVSFTTLASAQTANAVVFSENGDKFTLLLNGDKKNETPQVNVKVGGLVGEFFQARIDFEDPKLPDFNNNNFMVKPDMEVTYIIRVNKKGEYVLRFASEGPKSFDNTGSTSSTPAKTTIDPEVRKMAVVDDAPAKTTPAVVEGDDTGTTITTTTATTKTTKPTTGEKVNVGMNVGGVTMGVNISVEGTENMEMETEDVQMTTTTKTTTTKTITTQAPPRPANPQPQPQPQPVAVAAGCSLPMTSSQFQQAKSTIDGRSFEEDKLTVARQATKANCLSTAQIKEIMGLFSFEESKLDYAKFAYDYCTDKGNYYLLNDAFSFDSSVSDLNEFLETK
jgi:hypothetical protein